MVSLYLTDGSRHGAYTYRNTRNSNWTDKTLVATRTLSRTHKETRQGHKRTYTVSRIHIKSMHQEHTSRTTRTHTKDKSTTCQGHMPVMQYTSRTHIKNTSQGQIKDTFYVMDIHKNTSRRHNKEHVKDLSQGHKDRHQEHLKDMH